MWLDEPKNAEWALGSLIRKALKLSLIPKSAIGANPRLMIEERMIDLSYSIHNVRTEKIYQEWLRYEEPKLYLCQYREVMIL